MANRPVSLRIPEEVRAVIEDTVRCTGRDFSSIANEMLSEAVKMRRIPGIVFADGPAGRVARVAGTGLEVFEIIMTYRDIGQNWERFRESYGWLSEQQLRAALAYAMAYPDEIQARIENDEYWTPERLWARYPFTKPRA